MINYIRFEKATGTRPSVSVYSFDFQHPELQWQDFIMQQFQRVYCLTLKHTLL